MSLESFNKTKAGMSLTDTQRDAWRWILTLFSFFTISFKYKSI